jgi:predicted anti-sigma-YlaC factor YlaD
MTNPHCEFVRDSIPDFVAGRLTTVAAVSLQAHLADCEECRSEADLVGLLYSARPEVPAALGERIEMHVHARRRGVTRPWWGVAAAALAAVALGVGVSSRSSAGDEKVPAYVAEMQGLSPWVSDDGLLAGAPALDELSDEGLQILLDEMGAGGSGGAA